LSVDVFGERQKLTHFDRAVAIRAVGYWCGAVVISLGAMVISLVAQTGGRCIEPTTPLPFWIAGLIALGCVVPLALLIRPTRIYFRRHAFLSMLFAIVVAGCLAELASSCVETFEYASDGATKSYAGRVVDGWVPREAHRTRGYIDVEVESYTKSLRMPVEKTWFHPEIVGSTVTFDARKGPWGGLYLIKAPRVLTDAKAR